MLLLNTCMPSNNRIYTYSCDTCKRSVERIANTKRPDPLRCIITDQCEGRLSLTGSKLGLRPKNTKPVAGLADRQQRGFPQPSLSRITDIDPVSIASSSENHLSLSILRRRVDAFGVVFFLNDETGSERVLERRPVTFQPIPLTSSVNLNFYPLSTADLSFKQYTYVRQGRAVSVSGRDDSVQRSELKFTNDDIIRVFVNGERIDSIIIGNNEITFNPQVEATTILIEVFVYKPVNIIDQNLITVSASALSVNSNLRSINTWGDVEQVNGRHILYATDVGVLDESKLYILGSITATDENSISFTVKLDDSMLLL